ncbi:MAG: class I SAM-dependent methyltransferase [Candidatus Hodarchaeota archaeon]
MKKKSYIKDYAENQYKNHKKLDDRINLWSYGTNPISLYRWIFSKIQLKELETVLELGCGTGQLWYDNFRNIPSSCGIVLSDFSKGMLKEARKKLKPLKLPISFKVINAEEIPYPNHFFDVVLACHMLYHIPNISKALKSICRVLKPGGRFISTTISYNHIHEIKNFLLNFELNLNNSLNFFNEFRNETGRDVLKPFFEEIEVYEYINPVEVPSVDPLMKYISSMFSDDDYPIFQELKPQIEEELVKIIESESKFKITGHSGLFKAIKPLKNRSD